MTIPLTDLIAPLLGASKAESVAHILDMPLIPNDGALVPRGLIALGLCSVLFSDLLQRVPSGAAYVTDVVKAGGNVVFDHGALRTVKMPSGYASGFPNGYHAFARLLEPLGYRIAGTYPLPALRMTGYAFCHLDYPEHIPQFFVSELHVEQFDTAFVETAERVFGNTADPVDQAAQSLLDDAAQNGPLEIAQAQQLIANISACFACHHSTVHISDYEALLQHSAEAAWIATEGNAFNHVTDRVPNVESTAEIQRALGRPIKDKVEVSSTGQVRQTAFKADKVERIFLSADGESVARTVPGSFYEFISRDIAPETGLLDLRFDSSNAQGIFGMTAAG
jgi:hypothetical protein